jgi:hypothetical protein
MTTNTTCTFGYPASLSSGSHNLDTFRHDVASTVADMLATVAIFAMLVLFLAVTP